MENSIVSNAMKMKIEGHRGGRLDYENTISGFEKAVENGLDSIEFDVWLTSDKVPIILHGGLNGEVEHNIPDYGIHEDTHINAISIDAIKSIILPNGDQIPTLEEVIDTFLGRIKINWEVKEENSEFAFILLDLLKEKKVKEGFLVSSFNQKQLINFNEALQQDK